MTVRMSAAQALSDGVIVDNEAWLPLITEWPKRSISYFSDGYPDPVSLSHGSLAFQLGDDFDNQHWSRYDWDGALLEIYIGESGTALSQYRQIFAGTAGPIERDGNIAKVVLRGPEAALETNILTNEYLGTGGAEGDANLTGNVKPKAFGKCFNIAPVLIDSAYQIYQFHDGAAAAVHGVYENGYPIASSAKATVTTYSALANLTLTVGEYAIAPAAGMIRLGGQPRGKVTADITGANGTTIASIVKALLTQFGAVYNTTSLNAWNQEWNLYLTDQMSVGDAVRSAFDGQGFLFPDSLGRFRACNFYGTAKTPIALRDDRSSLPLVNSVKQLPSASPAYGVRVGHTRTWAIHSASEISEAIRDAGIETANAKEAARLAQEAADEAKADAVSLKVRLDDFAEDGKLSSAEKLIIIQRMAEFNTERPSMEADADRYSITTAKTNYQSKLDALNTYLASLSPAWNNVAVSTPIVRNTFKAKFTDFTTARVALLGKFADAASSITGSLTNDSHVLIANSAGTVSDFSDANGVFTVMKGIADVTSAATFTKVSQTGCTATIGTDGYYSVTAMSADKANVKLRATYEGVSINKTFTLAKARAGAQGSTGPAGAAGAQGNSLYTWIAYANNSTGTSGFTTGVNTGQTYIGIANNKTTETESTNPADYTWSRITGTDGVRGSDGADGQPTYTWFAYANNSTGTSGFTTGEAGTRSYVGIAANKNTPVEGTNPADYNWAKIQGDTGPQGPQGPTGSKGDAGSKGDTGAKGDRWVNMWKRSVNRPATPSGKVIPKNYCIEGDGNNNAVKWSANMVSAGDKPSAAPDGAKCLRVLQDVVRQEATSYNYNPQGRTFRVRCYIKPVEAGGGFSFSLRQADGTYIQNFTDTLQNVPNTASSWAYYDTTHTCTASSPSWTVATDLNNDGPRPADVRIWQIIWEDITDYEGWSTDVPEDNGQNLWLTRALLSDDDTLLSAWSMPVYQGEAGKSLVFDVYGGRGRLGLRNPYSGLAYEMVEAPDVMQTSNMNLTAASGGRVYLRNGTTNLTSLNLSSAGVADLAYKNSVNLASDEVTGKNLANLDGAADARLSQMASGASTGTNLIRNPTMDAGTVHGWTGSSGAYINRSGVLPTGEATTTNGYALYMSDVNWELPGHPVLYAGRYRFRGWMRTYGFDGYANFALRTSTGGYIMGFPTTRIAANTGYTYFDEYVTIPNDIYDVCPSFDVENGLGSDRGRIRAYGCSFELVDRLLDYVDGKTRRLINTRALPPVAAMNLAYKFTGNISYSASAGSPASATISVSAGQALIGSSPVSYNSMSVNVSGSGGSTNTYHLYVTENPDPTAWGGSKTLRATTNGNTIYSNDDNVWIGTVSVVFPTSGSGSGSGGGGGGGGTPYNPNNPPTQIP